MMATKNQQSEKAVVAGKAQPKREEEEEQGLFQDTSTECAICLLPFDDVVNGEDDIDVITLTCGHRWHLHCIKQQLEHAKPNPAKRLVFTGCTCAKCGTVCSNHPDLQTNVARKVDSLRQRVQVLLLEQLEIDKNDDDTTNEKEEKKNATYHQERLDRAWKKYAFYLCANCDEPYFGGTIECADQIDGEIVEAKDRLCVACRETTSRHGSHGSSCRNVAQHRSFLVWKCRYCCQPATFVCYGNVHFCESCHDRNTQRVQQQQRQAQHSGVAAPLQPVPCPGGAACPFPKPKPNNGEGQNNAEHHHHINVPTSDGEQVYGCTLCQSTAAGSFSRWNIPEGSRNLIINSSGQDGLRHWQQLRHPVEQQGGGGMSMSWRVERSDLRAIPAAPLAVDNGEQDEHDTALAPLTTNFVSSFQWCSMAQHVPLYQYVRDPSQARIEVAAQYMGRTDCPSFFRLEAVVLNRQGRFVRRTRTEILTTPQDDWDRASLILEPPQTDNNDDTAAHSLLLIVHGKDGRFWQGLFGAKVADCSVRILGSPRLLQEQMLDDDVEVVPVANQIRRQDVAAWPLFQRQGRQGQEPGNGGRPMQQQVDRDVRNQHHDRRLQQQNPDDAWNRLFQQAVLPVVVFFLFLWLIG